MSHRFDFFPFSSVSDASFFSPQELRWGAEVWVSPSPLNVLSFLVDEFPFSTKDEGGAAFLSLLCSSPFFSREVFIDSRIRIIGLGHDARLVVWGRGGEPPLAVAYDWFFFPFSASHALSFQNRAASSATPCECGGVWWSFVPPPP